MKSVCLILALVLSFAPLRAALIISGNATVSGNVQMLAGSLAAPTKAVNVFPLDGAAHVDPNITLLWAQGGGATGFSLYLDTQASHNPPTTKVLDNQNQTSYTPSPLSYNTVYNYIVDAVNNIGTTAGDKITFTTAVPTIVDGMIRFEAGSNTDLVTPTLLNSATFGSYTWTISPDPAVDLTISTEQEFQADAVSLADSSGLGDVGSTRSMRCQNNANTQRIIVTLGQHPVLSVGFALYLGPGFGSTAYNMDFMQMVSGTVIDPDLNPPGATNDFSAANWQDNTRKLKAHTQAGKNTGISVPYNGRWYWVTILWDAPNLLTTTKIYDTTTKPWTLVGTDSLALMSFNCHSLQFGHIDNTSGFINSPHWTDDIIWDTAGTFPLFPDEALGP